jgi:hypothetical protein
VSGTFQFDGPPEAVGCRKRLEGQSVLSPQSRHPRQMAFSVRHDTQAIRDSATAGRLIAVAWSVSAETQRPILRSSLLAIAKGCR